MPTRILEVLAVPEAVARWIRIVSYWVFTGLVAFEMVAGSLWDVLRIEYVRVVLTHLGYPLYLLFIIGSWKLPCALVLLAPRFLRLKEWAYAGAFFNYSGAAASHVLAGDGPDRWVGPIVFAAITLASWALRPPARRIQQTGAPIEVRTFEWVATALAAVIMVVVSLASLPKGPPPGDWPPPVTDRGARG